MLSPSQCASEIQKELVSQGINGEQMPALANAIGKSVVTIIISYQGTAIAPVGSGSSSGVGITVQDGPIASLMMSTAGFSGASANGLFSAISKGVANHLKDAKLTGFTNGPVQFPAVNAGIPTMSAMILSECGFSGPFAPIMALAIATGVCSTIATSGTGTLAGAAGPTPGPPTVIIS